MMVASVVAVIMTHVRPMDANGMRRCCDWVLRATNHAIKVGPRSGECGASCAMCTGKPKEVLLNPGTAWLVGGIEGGSELIKRTHVVVT